MSRFQYTNRNLELLEPYEWKRSRTVLRGEDGSNAVDLPDRPPDLTQREGRAIRKGNEIAKLYADNKVDVILYAVEQTLDAYKFNLLHNKQLFITQLKRNSLGSRTIDEGSLDEKSGMNFAEYVAILSGNTELLEKARLEKKITSLESERQAFMRGKSSSRYKLEGIMSEVEKNSGFISRISKDIEAFKSRIEYDAQGNLLNPVRLDGMEGSGAKLVAGKLNEIALSARTHGTHEPIGPLYGFTLMVKTETTQKEGIDFAENRFFVRGEGAIAYHYNNGILASADPKLASLNLLNALDTMPKLLERYQSENQKLEKDVSVLKEVIEGNWRKEPELKALKDDLIKLDREIQLSLKPIEESEGQENASLDNGVGGISTNTGIYNNQEASIPGTLKDVKEIMGDRLVIASVGSSPPKVEKKGIKL